MKCDLCGEPATVHMAQIRSGKKSEMHRCAAHVEQPDEGPAGTVRQVMTDSTVHPAHVVKSWDVEFLKSLTKRPSKP